MEKMHSFGQFQDHSSGKNTFFDQLEHTVCTIHF